MSPQKEPSDKALDDYGDEDEFGDEAEKTQNNEDNISENFQDII